MQLVTPEEVEWMEDKASPTKLEFHGRWSGRGVKVYMSKFVYKTTHYYVVVLEAFGKRNEVRLPIDRTFIVEQSQVEKYGLEEMLNTFRLIEGDRCAFERLAWAEIECSRRCKQHGIPVKFNHKRIAA